MTPEHHDADADADLDAGPDTDPDAAAALAGAEVDRAPARSTGPHVPRTHPVSDAQKRELDAGITSEQPTQVYPRD